MNKKEKIIKKVAESKEKIYLWINKNLFFICLLLFGIFIFNKQWSNFEFFVRANWNVFIFVFPFCFLFIYLYKRKTFSTSESFWTVISVLTAVLFFLFQNANQDATKGFAIYSAHQYNCGVADSIISLDQHENKSENFALHFFVTEPYFENVDLLFGNYGEIVGRSLLYESYKMQSANTLITIVLGLNVQGVNPLNTGSGYFIDMYNKQLISIAKEIKASLPCNYSLEKEKYILFNYIRQSLLRYFNYLKIKFNF